MEHKRKNLALFFTLGVSLKTWYEKGMIDREVKTYNKLSKNFDRIFFFTYSTKEDLNYKSYIADNINIVTMPKIFSTRFPKKILLLTYSILMPFIHFKILKEVDFLKTNQMKGAWAALIAKVIYKKILIVRTGYMWSKFICYETNNVFKRKIVKFIERFIYKYADGIITSSKEDYNYMNYNYKTNGMCIVVPNYIDISKFKPMNLEKKENSICFVGRLEKQKNLFELLKSFMGLSYRLMIIGDGSLKSKLKKYAEGNKVNVEFLGTIPNDNLPRILNECEIFILPSLYEGMPKTLLEAMACGLPVIGTNVDGIKEVIMDKINGVLCDTDSESIRNTIINLIGDNNLKARLGINARNTIVRNYSLDEIIKRELKLYKELS